MKNAICFLSCLLLLACMASAHPGRTDSEGGHYDRSTGEYHYHHGKPAHQHENDVCPYDSTTNITSNSETNTPIPEYQYDQNDGTCGTAYNAGYDYGMKLLLEINYSFPVDLTESAERLCEENHITDDTLLSESDFTFEEFFEDGYYQAEEDLQNYLDSIITPCDSNFENSEMIQDTGFQEQISQKSTSANSDNTYELSESEKQEAREGVAQGRSYPYLYLIFIIIGIVGWIIKKIQNR